MTSIFFYSNIDIISFNSNNFDSILENCKKHEILAFSHVSLYIFIAVILRFLKYKDNWSFLVNFTDNLSYYSQFLLELTKNVKQMMTKPERLWLFFYRLIDIILFPVEKSFRLIIFQKHSHCHFFLLAEILTIFVTYQKIYKKTLAHSLFLALEEMYIF